MFNCSQVKILLTEMHQRQHPALGFHLFQWRVGINVKPLATTCSQTNLPLVLQHILSFNLPPSFSLSFLSSSLCGRTAADKWLFIMRVLDASQLWDALLCPEGKTYWCLSPTLGPDVNSLAWCSVRSQWESFAVKDQQPELTSEQTHTGILSLSNIDHCFKSNHTGHFCALKGII